MALKTSEVYRCLEKKTLIFGFELIDIFMVFSLMAVLNFILGDMPYKLLFTWGPAILAALLLRLGKAGKPDNYLKHLAQFYFSPGVLSAFPLAPRRSYFVKKSTAGKSGKGD